MRIINISYISKNKKSILKDISLSFPIGTITTIVGKNGSGKSTLLKLLLGILKPSKGNIEKDKSFSFSYVPDSSESYFEGLTPLMYFNFIRTFLDYNSEEFSNSLSDLMKKLNFKVDLLDKKINILSLGEKKKVMIIGAFLKKFDVLILDEPFSGLDVESIHNLNKMILELKEGKKIVVMVSHDFDIVKTVSTQVVHIRDGIAEMFSNNEEKERFFLNYESNNT